MKKPRLVRGFFVGNCQPCGEGACSRWAAKRPKRLLRSRTGASSLATQSGYTENRATMVFKSTANRDNSWLAALVWFAPVDV